MNVKEWPLAGIEDLQNIVASLFASFPVNRIFLFYGELGAGKTTLIKHMIQYLGSSDSGGSPSFGLINQYNSERGTIYHMDLYRIKHTIELLDLGIEEYIDSGAWCFIEWPEKLTDILPAQESVKVKIDYISDRKRCITAEL